MIAWRIGWVVAPGELGERVSRVQIYNGPCAEGVRADRSAGRHLVPDDDLASAKADGNGGATRRFVNSTFAGGASCRSVVALAGRRRAWMDCVEVSDRLLVPEGRRHPMRGWGGEIADRHVRFVFSNEPVERLALLGDRVRRALATR